MGNWGGQEQINTDALQMATQRAHFGDNTWSLCNAHELEVEENRSLSGIVGKETGEIFKLSIRLTFLKNSKF